MIERTQIEERSIGSLLQDYPFLESFFNDNRLDISDAKECRLPEYFARFNRLEQEEKAIDPLALTGQITDFINQMLMFLGEDDEVRSITLLPGTDKSGTPEGFDSLVIKSGEVISIVGPTGSGKSRLLGDIEWVAQSDTPTGRRILINGDTPDNSWRFSSSKKLVAQLSQNMNFVMDLEVREFVSLHAESRLVQDADNIVDRIIAEANELAGEPFSADTPITSLSGGQSRALMIADTAILSSTPIVLIDEIENAGIDRKRALKLLLSEDKIVLMATHDPILALMADKRLVIKNGGIARVLETTDEERELLSTLEQLDQTLMGYRNQLRFGDSLTLIDN
ncbi:ATP-binding cassette domain-containing protein [Vibrio sp. JC009]|uniref:ATP-binding cassette domain-containing protein n=1 Tax=Vibrio sp. JC009 TaxID=2912314 RepID=UPI0023B11382|nr:ATP-binding cassette domain-containing protein [Vibrio sp. JC009]WED23930.1 ATP-binding cassette domain-containing protein [Vibrio sp. JC009]